MELATLARWQEHNTSDRAAKLYVYQELSGLSVYLPPEVLVTLNGMVEPEARPDLTTLLRCIYAIGNTPMIFNGVLPGSVEELKPEVRERFL